MRWWWIDRFLEFHSGKSARTVKNVSLAEDQLSEYMPGFPVMPHSLIIEGMAQTGGLLVGQLSDFRRNVVLAKISKAKFYFSPQPGDQLIYDARLESVQPDGALVCGTSHRVSRRLAADAELELQAEIDLYFAYFDNRGIDRGQFVPADFLRMLRTFKLYDVGVDADGNKLQPPVHLREAEQRQFP